MAGTPDFFNQTVVDVEAKVDAVLTAVGALSGWQKPRGLDRISFSTDEAAAYVTAYEVVSGKGRLAYLSAELGGNSELYVRITIDGAVVCHGKTNASTGSSLPYLSFLATVDGVSQSWNPTGTGVSSSVDLEYETSLLIEVKASSGYTHTLIMGIAKEAA